MHRLDLGPQLTACAGYRQARYVRDIVAVSTRPAVSDRSSRAMSDAAADDSLVIGQQMDSWGRSVLQLRRHRSRWTRAPAIGKSTCDASIRRITARSRSRDGAWRVVVRPRQIPRTAARETLVLKAGARLRGERFDSESSLPGGEAVAREVRMSTRLTCSEAGATSVNTTGTTSKSLISSTFRSCEKGLRLLQPR